MNFGVPWGRRRNATTVGISTMRKKFAIAFCSLFLALLWKHVFFLSENLSDS
jgi:hypothetical protein